MSRAKLAIVLGWADQEAGKTAALRSWEKNLGPN